jgi:hypothetical protein
VVSSNSGTPNILPATEPPLRRYSHTSTRIIARPAFACKPPRAAIPNIASYARSGPGLVVHRPQYCWQPILSRRLADVVQLRGGSFDMLDAIAYE